MGKASKVIVVGINHAGTSAIRTLEAQNPDLVIHAYDRNTNISFLGCGIALAVGGTVGRLDDLFYCDAATLHQMGTKVFMEHDVVAVDTEKKTVRVCDLRSGREFEDSYDKLVYATGSWPLAIPGMRPQAFLLDNVMNSKLFQDVQELIARAENPMIQNVVVIGAGYIGIELAEAYHKRGKQVTLIDYEPRIVSHYFDPEFTEHLESDIRQGGITLAVGERAVDFIGDGGKVKEVVTDKGRYPADLVIVSVGFKPNTELLPDAAKIHNGALIVDSHMRTSIPDVYAIGDAVALFHAALRSHQQVALATNAVKSGIAAASHINGIAGVEVSSVAGTNAICVFGNHLASTGLTEEAARAAGLDVASSFVEDADRPEFMNDYGLVRFKLVYDKADFRLLGAQVGSYGAVNHTEVIYFLALAIQKEMKLPEIAFTDVYFLPHYNKPFNFILTAILKALGLNYAKPNME